MGGGSRWWKRGVGRRRRWRRGLGRRGGGRGVGEGGEDGEEEAAGGGCEGEGGLGLLVVLDVGLNVLN